MASTKRVNSIGDRLAKSVLERQIDQLTQELRQKLTQYKNENGKEFSVKLVEQTEETYNYITPKHYVQEDGRQTWEHMIDDKGKIFTAIFCDSNSYKYNDRCGKKPNEDVNREKSKIVWYDTKFETLKEEIKKESDVEFKRLAKYLSEELDIDVDVRRKNIWS